MEISIQKLQTVLVGIVGVAIVGLFFYLGYMVFFTGPKVEEVPSLTSVSPSAFSGFAKAQRAASVVGGPGQKLSFKKKDYAFADTAIYKYFTDDPVSVELSERRGREDPFVPLGP